MPPNYSRLTVNDVLASLPRAEALMAAESAATAVANPLLDMVATLLLLEFHPAWPVKSTKANTVAGN